MPDECPIVRTVHVLAVPTKPAPGVLVAGENTMQVQIQKIGDSYHEWVMINPEIYLYKAVCKWCLQVRNVATDEIPT